MTIEEVQKRLDEIRSRRKDDESAHSMEDDLYHDFVREVSRRRDELGKMARTILKSEKIKFDRWCS